MNDDRPTDRCPRCGSTDPAVMLPAERWANGYLASLSCNDVIHHQFHDRPTDDLPAELERTHGSYIKRMSDGENSIIVRTKDEELAECYRMMGDAAARIRELEAENAEWKRAAREAQDAWDDR